MPIFEYSCDNCGIRFEKLQNSEETGNPSCPTCGGAEVQKVLSTFAPGAGTNAGDCYSG